MKRSAKIGIGVAVVLVGMQLVRFEHTNPPVTGEIDAPPEVKSILRRACYDCHSNETVWLWYSQIAPASWLIARDVNGGRRHLNFSEWASLPPDKAAKKRRSSGKQVEKGEMPLWFYLPLHPAARLSDADKAVIQAWAQTGPAPAPGSAPEHHGHDD
jgi:hypothetical protein